MKKNTLLACALVASLSVQAEKTEVKEFRHAGPYAVQVPYMMDSVNVQQKAFDLESLLGCGNALPRKAATDGTLVSGAPVPGTASGYALNELSFTVTNTRYAKATLTVEGMGIARCSKL